MKLLLTSEGFYNETIKRAFYGMLEKPVEETNIVLVTTAANAVEGDKRWLISVLNQLHSMGFKTVDFFDFAGLPKELWLPRMESSDVIFFNGGNTAHLMYEIKKAGLGPELRKLLETRIYIGNSAGSIAATKNLSLSNPKHKNYCSSRTSELDNVAMGLVDFLLRPHYNLPGHPSSEEDVLKMMQDNHVTERVYLIDDNTAVKVIDGQEDVVSEGEWKVFNN